MYSNSQNDFKQKVEHKVFLEFSKLSHQEHYDIRFNIFYPELSCKTRTSVDFVALWIDDICRVNNKSIGVFWRM